MLQFILSAFLSVSSAESVRGNSDQRMAELEKSVQILQQKVEKLESTLTKGGGFTIVTNFTCEIETPFNGSYSATELSEKAARHAVVEACKAKVSDASQCGDLFVKCKK